MNLSLDYDETYTKDPQLWDWFAEEAIGRGHKVYCVSFRDPTDMDNPKFTLGRVIGENNCFGTSAESKSEYMWKNHGVIIDVWIDDMPQFIQKGVYYDYL